MYKNIIFDLYGTLVDISTNESKPSLWKNIANFYSFNGAIYTPIEIKKHYLLYVKQIQNECSSAHPDIDIGLVFEALYKQKGLSPSIELISMTAHIFRILSTKYLKAYENADKLLDTLAEKGKKVFLLTNAQRLFTIPEIKILGLYDKFDGMIISSDVKCCKPDKSIFELLIKKYQLEPTECLMVGNDAEADIYGAYSAGIDSIYIKSNLSPNIVPKHAKYCLDVKNLLEVASYV